MHYSDPDTWAEIATKLATCNYKIENNNTISLFLHTGEHIYLGENDESDIYTALNTHYSSEPMVNILLKLWNNTIKEAFSKRQKTSMIDILSKYLTETPIFISPSTYVFKLWFSKRPRNILRGGSGRSWIDYNKQIIEGKIYDIQYGCGLWCIFRSNCMTIPI